jgi:hypothetical protein
MENKSRLQAFLPHISILLLFITITFIYFPAVFQGKTLMQHDIVQAKAAAREVADYHTRTGRWPLWTNSIFGGMPAYLIGTDYPNSWSTAVGRLLTNLLPEPANLLFISLIGFYILLITLNFNVWLAAIGAIAFAFCSANLVNIEAGHSSKVIAIAYSPPIIAGVILAYRGRYLLGGALTALFLALQLYGNHVQITYYVFLSLGLYGVYELIYAIREKRLAHFGIASAVLALAMVLSVGSHASRILTTYEYSKESIRGNSDLTQASRDGKQGLDKDYAFRWSYGIAEPFTLLIPNFYGGASQGELSTSSNFYKALVSNGIAPNQAVQYSSQVPLYWGQQPGTGGPAYAGAIVLFLFVLGMLIVRNPIKWWLLAVTLLFILFTWGKNFAAFNYLIFDYLPGYNKFRAVTMVIAVAQIYLCVLAVMAVREIIQEKLTWQTLKKPIAISAGVTAGLALLLGLFAGAFFDFAGGAEAQVQYPAWLTDALRDDRKSLFQRDAFRAVFFILATAALLWAYVQHRVKLPLLYAGLLLLVWIDMFTVSKRYLNNDDFVNKRRSQEQVQASEANLLINQDKSIYRVIDLSGGIGGAINSADISRFHLSVGGYHGAKMKRYQEVLDSVMLQEIQNFAVQLQQQQTYTPQMLEQLSILNMLNTKYLILAPSAQGVITNTAALGNAWFVDEYKVVPNANAEIQAIAGFSPARTAIVDQRYQSQLSGLSIMPDNAAKISLSAYEPDHLTYQSTAASPQLAVFSEIFYRGNEDWQAFIDGKPVPHFRANYILRAMVVPAGSHKIEFRFEPKTYHRGETIALISSILLFGGVAVAFLSGVEKKKERVSLSKYGKQAILFTEHEKIGYASVDSNVCQ